MNLSRVALAVVSVVVMGVGILTAVMLGARVGDPGQSVASIPPIRTPPAVPQFPVTSVHDGALVPTGTRSPTAHKDQSKLWFAQGAWWAVMTAPGRPTLTIHRLDEASQQWIDTKTLIDERENASPDVLWDGRYLVVASAVNHSGPSAAARIARYEYVEAEGRYALDADFPVRISERGVEGIVLARDSRGILWASYTQDGQVFVNHSTVNDAVWAGPQALPWPEALALPDDIASVVAYGGDRVAVLWTNQRIGSVMFVSRSDEAPPEEWGEPEVALRGDNLADDHLNAKVATDGTIYVAIKTSQDEPAVPNREAPLTVLLERTPDGEWLRHQYGRVSDRHTRPIVVLDEAAGIVYMFAVSPGGGGTVYVKWSRIDQIEFPAGRGQPVLAAAEGQLFADPTATKDPVDATRGFVVLAFDQVSGRYVHAFIGGRSGSLATPAPTIAPGLPVVYVHDTFEPWSPGEVPGNGWELRDPTEGRVVVATDLAHGRIAVLSATDAVADARACRPFATVLPGPLTVEVSARAEGLGTADIVALSIRGSGGDAVSIRLGQGGRFSYYDGTTKVRSEVRYRPGSWYRIRATIDPDARTAALEIVDESSGQRVLAASGLAWRSQEVTAPGAVCTQVPGGPAAPSLAFDDIEVRQP